MSWVFTRLMIDAEEVHALELLRERLADRFPSERPEGIERLVAEVHHQYDGSPVRAFIPVLVEREVSDRLKVPQPRRGDDRVSVSA